MAKRKVQKKKVTHAHGTHRQPEVATPAATIKHLRRLYLETRDTYLGYRGVVGVGFGGIERDGKLTGELGLIVLVEQKLAKGDIPDGEFIPSQLSGIPVDVREPRFTAEQHAAFAERNGLSEQEAECNMDHFWLDDGAIHRLHQRRRRRARKDATEPGDPADPSTAVHGEIFVIEDDGSIIDSTSGSIDHVEAFKVFQAEFGDDYDFVFFHYATASGVAGPGNSSPTIYNQISGINHYKGDSYDDRFTWGSSKIQSYQKITGLSQIRRCLHETAHRWCSYVYHQEAGSHSDNLHEAFSSASQKPYHWGSWFDSEDSCMDYDYYEWEDSASNPGEFEQDNLNAGPPGTDEFGYHELDLYLMGLIDASEVGNFRYIQNPIDGDSDGSYTGTEVGLTITNVVDEEGARSPAYPNTQRVFHQAFILLTKDLSGIGTLADTSTVLGNFERYRAGLVEAFRRETNSRGMIDGSLLHAHYEDVYVRDNTADTGLTSSSGAFWNSPDIWVRNANDGGTTHQDTIRGQDNWVHVRVHNSNMADYEDVRVRLYRANFAGTEFFYPEDWHPDELIGEAVATIPGGGSETVVITWDAGLIPDATWHPCLLVEVIPMEVTPVNRHHVWDNRKLAQKNITIVDPPGDAARVEVAFRFGHPTRTKDRAALLTVARAASLMDATILLDTDGIVPQLVKEGHRLPEASYLPEPETRAVDAGGKEATGGGLAIQFPRTTEVLLGGAGCEGDPCMSLTICKGSRFIFGGRCADDRGGELAAEVRHGRTWYRLPMRAAVGLRIPLVGKGSTMMRAVIDPGSNRQGLLSIIQSEEQGTVVGGIDIQLL